MKRLKRILNNEQININQLNKSAFIDTSFLKIIIVHLFSAFDSFSCIFFNFNEKSDRIK